MHFSDLDDANFPLLRQVIKPFKGKFTTWRAGEKVLAKKTGRGEYAVRKFKLTKYSMPFNSVCGAVRSSDLMALEERCRNK